MKANRYSDRPLTFSIIIPTYNRAHLISQTIESILQQQYPHFEVVVIDDGSTDTTEIVLKSFTDSRICYYKKDNSERGAARNFGIGKASGDYITFLDSDDIIYLQHLQTAFDMLKQFNFPDCYAQTFEIKEVGSGKVIWKGYRSKDKLINKYIFKGNFLACFGIFIKREVLSEINFEEDRRFAGSEDWLLWLQISARYPFYFRNKVTGALLQHENRSVNFLNADNLLFRAEFIKRRLEADPVFLKAFGRKGVNEAYSHMLTYACLYMTVNEKRKAIRYFMKAIRINIKELLTQRSLAILKKILIER